MKGRQIEHDQKDSDDWNNWKHMCILEGETAKHRPFPRLSPPKNEDKKKKRRKKTKNTKRKRKERGGKIANHHEKNIASNPPPRKIRRIISPNHDEKKNGNVRPIRSTVKTFFLSFFFSVKNTKRKRIRERYRIKKLSPIHLLEAYKRLYSRIITKRTIEMFDLLV